ncbi:RAM signaling pathway protein-domain-containing protein [Apodospora peruviana]|uniref:RAM signaling pathway protein-domain-containing protein n=1 Tax=Apodospora peruviana TaxID=516989 RepID=A0AAE0M1I3_9PEZI|nr:RAM signaling pathway protein-domain-containing protein [Apodospora peruviana]
MDRPRGLPDNPAQGRRAVAAGLGLSNGIPPALPNLREMPSNSSFSSSLSTLTPLTSNQVLALAREAMRAAHENEAKAAEASGVSDTLKPGLTIDLSRRKIQKLPDEIVDVIKDELERLALSHNFLESFPARFAECTSLRYLNVRQNRIKEFPMALCDLKSLEILDLGRNMLEVLPPEIVKLSSLKVFSLPKNQITELPLCLADMPSLSVIRLEGNPLIFPPPEELQVKGTSTPNDGVSKDHELTVITAHIKRFLKQKASIANGREVDSPGDDAAEGTETPRPTIKRVFSGRFPIKVNGADVPDLRSPALPRPPPIPTRSHYRGLSQQNTAQRRPGVMPLTIGNPNERVRSNSETTLQTSNRERSESRSRRMGIVSKKTELSTLDEIEVNNRFSHYRGLSHGSAMQGNAPSMAAQSPTPASPADLSLQRPVYVRRLSILPERKRESKVFDPVLEAAKGILYSIFQIHPMIHMLMNLSNDGTGKRSSLEIVYYNTNAHVEQLELEIQKHDLMAGEDGHGPRENENVQRACITLVNAYNHVCSLLIGNVDLFLDNGDPRYIRTLLTQLYNSIMELRVTCAQVSAENNPRIAPPRADLGDTIRPHTRENSVAPITERPVLNGRPRNGTFVFTPSHLRVATDMPIPYINGTGRTATISAATPRSGESFTSTSTSGLRGMLDFNDEDRGFERIFLSLQRSSDLIMRILPTLNAQFSVAMRNATTQRALDHVIMCWRTLIAKCSVCIQQTEVLKAKLSTIKLKEPGVRGQASFWVLCNNFIDSWYEFVKKIKAFQNDLQLPLDTKVRLRPIHTSTKETWELMLSSPWSYYVKQGHSGGDMSSPYSTQLNTPVPLPMTPQSAALGPAVQATVPSTPQSASFNAAFTGNVFERADALISMGGLYVGRSGTMNSNSTVSLNSINSTLSSVDGVMTPASALSPGPLGPLPFRLNNGSKVGF